MENIENSMVTINEKKLELPGFRFHPTEEELLNHYLRKVVSGKKSFNIIAFLNIYHHEPWDLPGLARIGEREWYFFVARDKKHGHGGRPNRTTEKGFWKATGSDRQIRCPSDPKTVFGLRKTLVFYRGRAPRGTKTDWVMNEYRLPPHHYSSPVEEDIVLCKIYRKATSMKILEQRAAMTTTTTMHVPQPQPQPRPQPPPPQQDQDFLVTATGTVVGDALFLKTEDIMMSNSVCSCNSPSSRRTEGLIVDELVIPELEVPQYNMDLMMDPFWNQLRSPWLGNWSPYANIINF
ncbi:NAC domain-containing protein 6-like [Impatiens glandulifera]|uniref:NAC domain-containing protein 6-like n=1 Tax=Impatiens glandulifera TaxID=253017 RepID=UPI001FB0D99D|nr:NAC domain-containing protein 6-like [Impatiens glandulifera]